MKEHLHNVSVKVAVLAGSTWAFLVALLGVLAWLVSGPYFGYSDTWLIIISTITSIVVFLMVFSIQNTQNRDSKAVHIKLNELIAANSKARDELIGLESMTDDELMQLDEEFKKMLADVDESHALHKLHKNIAVAKNHRLPKRHTTQ